jgi:hypothetical protein
MDHANRGLFTSHCRAWDQRVGAFGGRSRGGAYPPARCGSKKKIESESQLEANLIAKLTVRVGGSPDDEDLIFTDLKPPALAKQLTQMGTPVSQRPVADWLRSVGVRLRKIAKTIAGGASADRSRQFERIGELIEQYESAGDPWFSIDTKAKEHLGRLYRKGRSYSSQPFEAFDHDFPSWADGVVIPHGIYDRRKNLGHLNLGLSRDTSEFACDSLRYFWNRFGKKRYADAKSILLTCDCGGSNAAATYLFRCDLQRLSEKIGLPIRVAHFPSYCSKYNPIERRFFPHVGRACEGQLFTSLARVVELMRRAATRTGLRTTVQVIEKIYQTGRKATAEMKESLRIVYDDLLPKWNYIASPMCATN